MPRSINPAGLEPYHKQASANPRPAGFDDVIRRNSTRKTRLLLGVSMSATALACPPISTRAQAKMDHVDWAPGQSFSAYGLRFGLRVNDATVLAVACAAAPLGWQAAPAGEVDVLYSLCVAPPSLAQPNEHLLSCGSALIARTPDL